MAQKQTCGRKCLQRNREGYSNCVKRLRQIGLLSLLVIFCIGPVMACMRADAQMSPEERACCRMMNNQCGEMGMPASHHCCQKTVQGAEQDVIQARIAALPPLAGASALQAAFTSLSPTPHAAHWFERPEHSPPESPPRSIPILRI